eukprot:Ihof_evm2s856 gene=Ihof_evmTU2s856
MEVLRSNFAEVFPQVEKAIKEASILAFDCEMTGIEAPNQRITLFDNPSERYAKYRCTASKFLVVQFGLACFAWDENTKQYTASVFNFYTFPRPSERQGLDYQFSCQAASIDFLCTNNMDWNKVIKEGISYLTRPQEAHARQKYSLDQ